MRASKPIAGVPGAERRGDLLADYAGLLGTADPETGRLVALRPGARAGRVDPAPGYGRPPGRQGPVISRAPRWYVRYSQSQRVWTSARFGRPTR